MALKYRAWCMECNAEWSGEAVDHSDVPVGEVRAFYACHDCGHVGRAPVGLTARELGEYRRALRKTIGRMTESYMRVKARLEERLRAFRLRLREGDQAAVDLLSATESKLADLRWPDLGHLERRLAEVEKAERGAPVNTPAVRCPACGGEARIHRETPRGYDMTCPRCGGRMVARVK